MVKKNILIIIVLLLLVINMVALSTILYNRWRFHHSDLFHPRDSFDSILHNEFKFNEEQMSRFKTIRDQFHPIIRKYDDSIEVDRKLIFKEIEKDTPNMTELNSIAFDLGRLDYQMKRKIIDHFLKIKAICNPKQQKQFFEFIEKTAFMPGNKPGQKRRRR